MKIDRRSFLKVSAWTIAGTAFLPGLTSCAQGPIRFGWVTDIHYALAPVKWGRYFSEGTQKLSEAITLFNQQALDFVIETGDFKDQNEPAEKRQTQSYLKEIEAQFAQFNGPRYHVLGNHDLDSLSKMEFQSLVQNSGITPDQTFFGLKREVIGLLYWMPVFGRMKCHTIMGTINGTIQPSRNFN